MKNIIPALAIVAITVISAFGLAYGMSRTERAECLHWQNEAKEYPGYYITEWQKEQCDAHAITIDAPVK